MIVNLIASTKANIGLTVRCELDKNSYSDGRMVSDKELAQVEIEHRDFHGAWNYTILPICLQM